MNRRKAIIIWYTFMLIWSIAFYIFSFYHMLIGDSLYLHAIMMILQSSFAIYWTYSLAKLKKKSGEKVRK